MRVCTCVCACVCILFCVCTYVCACVNIMLLCACVYDEESGDAMGVREGVEGDDWEGKV